MDWFVLFYTFLGGLGLFFFGMKTLSGSLQTLAGTIIRKVIHALTSNRLMAVGVGALVTTIVQSSSISTVMVVGFVNAGLMELTQAIGVIFGANIGTTITGWIIAIKVGKYGPLLLGLGMIPVMLPVRNKIKNIGYVFVALGMIFMGLKMMSGAFKPLRSDEGFLHLMQYFTADGYASLFACVFIGTILTFIIQSSSAMLGITIALASSGSITFQTAAALVLGENIGTTITAWLASIGMNPTAKQAARAHLLFNIFGVIWLSLIFWYYIDVIDLLVWGDPDTLAADGSKPYVAAHIAAGHTVFNVINTIVFLPFLKHLAHIVEWMVPHKREIEIPHLTFIPGMSPTLAVAAAQKQIIILGNVVRKGLKLTKEYVLSAKPNDSVAESIHRYEEISDNIQSEITHFLSRVQESRMSKESTEISVSLIRTADELESIADYIASMVRYRDRLRDEKKVFSEDAKAALNAYFDEVINLYEEIHTGMENETDWHLTTYLQRNDKLIEEANRIRDEHMQRLESGNCDPLAGMVFSDIIVGLRRMRSHSINVVEALSGAKTESHRDADRFSSATV